MPQPPPQAENPAFGPITIPSLPLPDDGPSRTQVSYLLLSVGLHEIASKLDGQFTAILLSWVPGLEFVHIKDLLLPASDEHSIIRTPICTPILLPHLTTLKVSDDGLGVASLLRCLRVLPQTVVDIEITSPISLNASFCILTFLSRIWSKMDATQSHNFNSLNMRAIDGYIVLKGFVDTEQLGHPDLPSKLRLAIPIPDRMFVNGLFSGIAPQLLFSNIEVFHANDTLLNEIGRAHV